LDVSWEHPDWVGFGLEKWTHVQLWSIRQDDDRDITSPRLLSENSASSTCRLVAKESSGSSETNAGQKDRFEVYVASSTGACVQHCCYVDIFQLHSSRRFRALPVVSLQWLLNPPCLYIIWLLIIGLFNARFASNSSTVVNEPRFLFRFSTVALHPQKKKIYA